MMTSSHLNPSVNVSILLISISQKREPVYETGEYLELIESPIYGISESLRIKSGEESRKNLSRLNPYIQKGERGDYLYSRQGKDIR